MLTILKSCGFRKTSRFWLLVAALVSFPFLVTFTGASKARAQTQIAAERMDEHTVLFTYEGKQYMGFDLEASKKLRQAENDAKEFKVQLDLCSGNLQRAKDNEQDLKVRSANVQRDYDAQSKLFDQCMALSKNGSGINNGWLRFGLDLAPTVVTLVKPCH